MLTQQYNAVATFHSLLALVCTSIFQCGTDVWQAVYVFVMSTAVATCIFQYSTQSVDILSFGFRLDFADKRFRFASTDR